MKLAEKHKQFVVKRFARFMKVPDIVEEFMEDFEDELYGIFDESTSNMQQRVRLSTLLRRLNITHSQFPEKYRDLFNEERENFLADYRDTIASHTRQRDTRVRGALRINARTRL